jgi:ABC-type sugar transport system ATPase subunit
MQASGKAPLDGLSAMEELRQGAAAPRRGAAPGAELLRVEGLSKTFPGTCALDGVTINVRAGEVHAVIGHNGSGKSTLIKVLSGFHTADPGAQVWLDGQPIELSRLHGAQTAGAARLSFVHQDLGLILELTALENLALHGGFLRRTLRRLDWREQARRARVLLESFDLDLDLNTPLSKFTPVERTLVAIAAALQGWDGAHGVLVLDEPTAVLPPKEAKRLFSIIRGLCARGAGVLYVSHRLDEIAELADWVSVLSDGKLVAAAAAADMDKKALIRFMLGEEASTEPVGRVDRADGMTPVLRVSHLRGRYVADVTFEIGQGEVVGLAGLPGDGRDELPRLLSDAAHDARGVVELRQDGAWQPVCQALGDVALVPPDRGREGIIADLTVGENLSLSVLSSFRRRGRLSRSTERVLVEKWLSRLRVRSGGASALVSTLSGGNQQKLLIGRALARRPKVLLLCEPTAGVDVGARRAIYEVVAEQAAEGLAVLVTSSDVQDLLSMCTRVLVLHRGRVIRQLTGADLNEHELVRSLEGAVDDKEAA